MEGSPDVVGRDSFLAFLVSNEAVQDTLVVIHWGSERKAYCNVECRPDDYDNPKYGQGRWDRMEEDQLENGRKHNLCSSRIST